MVEAASLTDLIRSARSGDSAALQSVFQQTYDELRRQDGDGLKDGDEVNVGLTDPISAATDCDGVKTARRSTTATTRCTGRAGRRAASRPRTVRK
jgi:Bacterial TSP3 repeat/ECF sigma factor